VRQGLTFAHSWRRCSVPEEPRYFAKIGRQNGGVKIEERFDEMAKGTFGERLKRERELREVTVKEIASATRIAPKFLEALENEDWNKLPGGVFGRGFVRSIARYLGLSEENLLSDYDLARGETSAAVLQKPEERIPSPPKWIPALAVVVLIAALVGVVFGGRYAWRRYAAHRAAKKASAVVSIPSSDAAQNLFVNGSPATPANATERSLALDLSVVASAASRVKIAADGLIVYDAELANGQNLHFSANDKFAVTAADFSALLLQLNGQKVMPAPTPGSSSTISLTSRDLRQAAGGPTQP
jgi:transcriptional regulator with XRE-family HTH domain